MEGVGGYPSQELQLVAFRPTVADSDMEGLCPEFFARFVPPKPPTEQDISELLRYLTHTSADELIARLTDYAKCQKKDPRKVLAAFTSIVETHPGFKTGGIRVKLQYARPRMRAIAAAVQPALTFAHHYAEALRGK